MTHVDFLGGDGHLFSNRIFTREVRGNKFGGALVPREVRGNKFGGVLVQVLGDAIVVVNNNKSPKIHNRNFYHLNLHSILRVKKLRLLHMFGDTMANDQIVRMTIHSYFLIIYIQKLNAPNTYKTLICVSAIHMQLGTCHCQCVYPLTPIGTDASVPTRKKKPEG